MSDIKEEFKAVSIALSRRVFPELFSNKIVGVNPMEDPKTKAQREFNEEMEGKLEDLGL